MAATENELKANDIDNILDEVENWDSILSEMKNGSIQNVKNLISSNDIDINAQNPQNGMTLLMYAVIIGNMDLVKALCNFGADASIKDNDGDDALHYSIKYGRYKITELIYYRTLSGSLGKDLQRVATDIHHKNEEAHYLMKKMKQNQEECGSTKYFVNLMINALKERAPFGGDMLYYSWYFINQQSSDALDSDLFKAMMSVYEEILCNTSDKKGWQWLKSYLLPSLIWYLPRPSKSESKDEKEMSESISDQMEHILQQTLFYELLQRVRKETKKQSDLLLKEKIREIKTKQEDEWNTMISYTVNARHPDDARQDICGTLKSQYSGEQLSEDKYPPSTHFSAKKFYDSNMYLSQLLFTANILDSKFQKDMKLVAHDIQEMNSIVVSFRAGPVKTLQRSQTKCENDYIMETYPTAAKILDINRCALQFKSIVSMMRFIDIFTQRVHEKKAYSIVDIVRCKNGWSVYDEGNPSYTDLKLNVLVKATNGEMLVAEVQFLLDLMSGFKKKAHKLYAVERRFEFVYNFGKLMEFMKQFNNITSIHDIFIDLAQKDNIKEFKFLFSMIKTDESTLSTITHSPNAAIFEIIRKNGNIYKYIHDGGYKDLFLETLHKYTESYGFDGILGFVSIRQDKDQVTMDNENMKEFLEKLYCSIKTDKEMQMEIITNLCSSISSLLPSQTSHLSALIDSEYKLNGFVSTVECLFTISVDFKLIQNYQQILSTYVADDDIRKYKLLCDLQQQPQIEGVSVLYAVVHNKQIANYLSKHHVKEFHGAVKRGIDNEGLFNIMSGKGSVDVHSVPSFIDNLFILTEGNDKWQYQVYCNTVTHKGNALQEKRHFIYPVANSYYDDHQETFTVFEWAVNCGDYEMIKCFCKSLNNLIMRNNVFTEKDLKVLLKGACLVNDAKVVDSILRVKKKSKDKNNLLGIIIEDRYETSGSGWAEISKYKKYTPLLYVVKKGYIESVQAILNHVSGDKKLLREVFRHEIEEWVEEVEDCGSECGGCLEIKKKGNEGNAMKVATKDVKNMLRAAKLKK